MNCLLTKESNFLKLKFTYNKVKLFSFKEETFKRGRYLFVEFRRIQGTLPFALEPYILAHWNEVRGLDNKYAVGVNLRWGLVSKKTAGVFVDIGPFYVFELWYCRGVPDLQTMPSPENPVTN